MSTTTTAEPRMIYLAIGLIAGPLPTSLTGLQVLSGTARDQTPAEGAI